MELHIDLDRMEGRVGFTDYEEGRFHEYSSLGEPVTVKRLTDRQYAEVIGSLQIARDVVQTQGLTGDGIQEALDLIGGGCLPTTDGMIFCLVDGPLRSRGTIRG